MLKLKIFFNKLNSLDKNKKIKLLNNLFKKNYINNDIINILFNSKNIFLIKETKYYLLLNNTNNINKKNLIKLFDKLKLNFIDNFFNNYQIQEDFNFYELNNSLFFQKFISNISLKEKLKFFYTYKYFEVSFIENNFLLLKKIFIENLNKKQKKYIYHFNNPIFIPYHLILQKNFEELEEQYITEIIELFIKLYEKILLEYQNNKISFYIFYNIFIIFKNLDLNLLEELNEKLINIENKITNKFLYNKISLLRKTFLFFNEEYSYQSDIIDFAIKNPDFLDNLHKNYYEPDIIIEILNELIFKHDFKTNNLSYIINKFFIYIKHFDMLNPLNFKDKEEYFDFKNEIKEIIIIDDLYLKNKEVILHKDFYLGVKTLLNYTDFNFDFEYDLSIINSFKYIYNDFDINNLNSNYIYYILYILYNKYDKIKNLKEKLQENNNLSKENLIQKLSSKEKKELSNIIINNNLFKHYFDSDINYYLPFKFTLIQELRKNIYSFKLEEELYSYYLKKSIISEKEQLEILKDLADKKFIYNLLLNNNTSIFVFDKLLENKYYLYNYGEKIIENILKEKYKEY